MTRKPTWYEKMIMDGVDSATGPGGTPAPEPDPNDQGSTESTED